MIGIPQGDRSADTFPQPGTWSPLMHPGRGNGLWSVLLCCPRGHRSHLTHAIAADGTASPSVVCPGERARGESCSFHDHVRLEGWEYGELPERPRG